ncbi:MAG TPA: dihydrolipoamide acetyltransferase family protein [Solirubrobacteraceae bacterium]|jgi:pyruvate dehydrogenase E2 component (dihydrolipoamide acetyltransferase)|nr:dihydrolipoamide acetyltransferase family protein [Solirubrobacteraceae bacterium]
MTEIVMPRLSDSMEEGTILKWLKADGDEISRGDPLAEIETDKATLTYESDAGGVLTIVAEAGDTLPIGSVIARLDSGSNGAAARSPAQEQPVAPAPELSQPAPAPARSQPAPTPHPEPVASQPPPAAPAPVPAASGRVKASPLARRMAREQGLDLQQLAGSGPGGRIVKADVERAAQAPAAQAAPPPVAAPTPPPESQAPPPPPPPPALVPAETGTAKGDVTVQELTRTQQLIARRMAESKATVPDFTLRSEIDMEACVRLRADLKALGGDVPSYNDMVVRASALALREFPRANGSYRDGRFELHSRVNVGVAVAAQDSLVVPTVFDADRKSLREIARETRALAERVRAGTVTPPELSGGTFTVSNLGMYGVTDFTAVINPPQAAILAVGALAQRPVVRDGALVARHTMGATLVCDHRILYGADAAEFLARIRALLEQPLALAF